MLQAGSFELHRESRLRGLGHLGVRDRRQRDVPGRVSERCSSAFEHSREQFRHGFEKGASKDAISKPHGRLEVRVSVPNTKARRRNPPPAVFVSL